MEGKVFTVLVVDDEVNIRLGAERILKRSGFDVVKAESGEQGLETLEKMECHIMLLDLMMPGIGGMEVLKRVSVSHPELLVVVITGYATLETAVEAMKEGAYDFIPKPFQPDQLRIVVFRAADTLRLKEEHKRLAEERLRTLKDIDAEKSRTRAIIDCMTEGVLVTDVDGEVVLHNSAALRLLDLEPSMHVGQPLESYVEDKALRTLILDVCKDCGEASIQKSEVELEDGRWLLAKVSSVETEWAGNAGALTVFSDITDIKELDRLRNDFVAKVSHELRSPLASINQQLAVVAYDLVDDGHTEQNQRLSRVRDRTRGLLGLISDLLDMSRIEQGEQPAERVELNAVEIVERAVDLIAPRAQKKNVTLSLQKPATPAPLRGDARELDSVFNNLITNAVNYTLEGGSVTVHVEVKGQNLVFSVTDSGVGISEQAVARIFDKFYRVKTPETRSVVGTGLGLPIVKGIVDSYGGTIDVASEVGKGTTFTVTLPCTNDE